MGNTIKQRKLYTVRYETTTGHLRARTVGHKARLLPRAAALRVVKRLKKAGVFAYVSALMVNVTPEQAAYLDRRYS